MTDDEYYRAISLVHLGRLIEMRKNYKDISVIDTKKEQTFPVPFIVKDTEKELFESIMKYEDIETYYFEPFKEGFYLLRMS